jgi:raffinose/stachyose/melibiose transport system substrate-binding protein
MRPEEEITIMTERSTSARRLAGLAAALAIAVSACGTASTPAASQPPASASAAPETAAPTVDPASIEGKINVSLWDYGNNDSEGWIGEFNETYPNVTVNLTNVDLTTYRQGLLLSLSSGTAADVVQLYESDTPQYVVVLEDLTPYAERTWGSDWQSEFAAGALDQQIIDGKLMGLPQYLAGPGSLFYNVDVFEKVGATVPTNYQELVDASKKLRDGGYQALGLGAKDSWINTYVYRTLAMQVAPGVQDAAAKCEASWTDPGLVATMALWKRFFDDGILGQDQFAEAQYPDAVNKHISGQSGMLFNGTWHNFTMTNVGYDLYENADATPGKDKKYIWLPIDFPIVNDAGNPALYALGTHGWGIPKSTENKDAAWAFISWYASPAGQKWIAKAAYIPINAGGSPDLSDVVDPTQVAALEAQTEYVLSGGGYGGPTLILNGDQATALGDAMAAVATGTQMPEEAMAAVQAASGC